MTTAWNHLPNAVHIDRIIASVKAPPEAWDQASDAAGSSAAWDAAWDRAWYAAGSSEARVAAWWEALTVTRDATSGAIGAIVALIAWDHSAKFLDMTADELKVWWVLSEDPACILLLPAVKAFEKIEQLELI